MPLGLAVAAVCGGFIVVELALFGVLLLRLQGRFRRLSELLTDQIELAEADLERLELALAETRALLRPYRRVWRWLRHPLVLALLASYRRRRSLARAAALGRWRS